MSELSDSQKKNIAKLQELVHTDTIKTKPIRKIRKQPYVGKVYDIHVDETNCYQLNGAFSSNSASGSLVCFLIGIHVLDPLLWGLSFDRFLASSRGGYMLNTKMAEDTKDKK
jgi:predicted dehydrogenase